MNTENKPIRSRTKERVINGVKYKVTCTFDESAKETVEQKLIRLVANRIAEELKKPENAVI